VGFTLLDSSKTGIGFTNLLSQARFTTNQIYLNGSGVAAGDVDGDGWCDLYFCGLDGPNVLYRNLGNWRFEDITQAAGVACPDLDATGAALVDIDGDGDLDLIVNSVGGGTHVFLNDGKGHFTRSAVLNSNRCGTSLALADFTGTGALDLYVCNYRVVTLRDQPKTNFRVEMVRGKPIVTIVTTVNGRPTTLPDLQGRFEITDRGRMLENGEPHAFFRNDGHGQFRPVSMTDGTFADEDGKPVPVLYDWGLSVMARDLNGDGAPDLYVCNDFQSPDRIWINDGHGRFRALPRWSLRDTPKFSMGMDVADVNRDGYDDLFVLDMLSRDHVTRLTRMDRSMGERAPGDLDSRQQVTRNTVQLNRGDGTYADVAYLSHLEATDWSWTPIFLDVDLDGYEDVLVSAGHNRDDMDLDFGGRIEALRKMHSMSPLEELSLRKGTPVLARPKLAFRNRRDLTFEEVGQLWGFNQIGVGQGMALADLDNDGDLDVIVNNMNAAAGLYRNDTTAPRVAVRLKGLPPNTEGIGARITVIGGPVTQSQEMICGGRYLSSDQAERVFAAGNATNTLRIEVRWRSGKLSVVEYAVAGRLYEVFESGARSSPAAEPPLPPTMFEDKSALLQHVHHDEPFDDFARQPLLANKLSQLGPGVAWFDVNGDGWEDLVIGSGKGGALALYQNDQHGGFRLATPGGPALRDQTAVVAGRHGGITQILCGSANYEDGSTNGEPVLIYRSDGVLVSSSFAGQASSTGPLAIGAVDDSRSLVLFVGGRVVPGKYPAPASSMLFRAADKDWQLDSQNTAILKNVGLVSGALWSDLDSDGYSELVLACDWGPIRVFKFIDGRLQERTREWKLDQFLGWWNGIAVGDFDGDGKLDLVASNWGRNTRYEAFRDHPLRVYWGDIDQNGTLEYIEAYFDSAMGQYVPWRGLMSMERAIPSLREHFNSHRSFAQAGVEDILGSGRTSVQTLEVKWLDSTIFLNRGGYFEPHLLPVEAQFSPAFGIAVGDFDGDGNEDLFLAQNFFDTSPEVSEYDAGRGLLLTGNGRGEFKAIPGQLSGIELYGEERGCAVADYDHDGRLDLVATQNSSSTHLYHNATARPGLRVRLLGPEGNPDAIGACLRVYSGRSWGPMREIHAGGGYWSEDAAVQVMTGPESITRVWVRWPGGKVTEAAVPAGAKDMKFSHGGELTVVQ
jgi:hypothetical protein